MLVYKMTDYNWKTRNDTRWGYGVSHRCHLAEIYRCGYHAYKTPVHAALISYITDYNICWLAKGTIGDFDKNILSCTFLKTLEPYELPQINDEVVAAMAEYVSKRHFVTLRSYGDVWNAGYNYRFYCIQYMYDSHLDIGDVYARIC